jgi:hypothetical protein
MTNSAARAFDDGNAINMAPNSAIREKNFNTCDLLANFVLPTHDPKNGTGFLQRSCLSNSPDPIELALNISEKMNMSMRACPDES